MIRIEDRISPQIEMPSNIDLISRIGKMPNRDYLVAGTFRAAVKFDEVSKYGLEKAFQNVWHKRMYGEIENQLNDICKNINNQDITYTAHRLQNLLLYIKGEQNGPIQKESQESV